METTTEATKETYIEKSTTAPEEAPQVKCKGKGKVKDKGKNTQKPIHCLWPQATSSNKTY